MLLHLFLYYSFKQIEATVNFSISLRFFFREVFKNNMDSRFLFLFFVHLNYVLKIQFQLFPWPFKRTKNEGTLGTTGDDIRTTLGGAATTASVSPTTVSGSEQLYSRETHKTKDFMWINRCKSKLLFLSLFCKTSKFKQAAFALSCLGIMFSFVFLFILFLEGVVLLIVCCVSAYGYYRKSKFLYLPHICFLVSHFG